MYRNFFKPIMDFCISFVSIILLAPLFLVLIFAIKVDSRGPVLFKQDRVGKHKRIFKIYKFRTMRIDTPKDTPTHLLGNPEMYITRVGRFLRKTSLDELPQIFNIVFGKMSVIGPRPALWNQDDLIAERDNYGANDVRPGLSGWAQINGRDELAIPVKARLDGEYVERMGFFFDVRVFFGTFLKVFRGDGVVEGNSDPVEKLEGGDNAEVVDESLVEEEEVATENGIPAVDGVAEPVEQDAEVSDADVFEDVIQESEAVEVDDEVAEAVER